MNANKSTWSYQVLLFAFPGTPKSIYVLIINHLHKPQENHRFATFHFFRMLLPL